MHTLVYNWILSYSIVRFLKTNTFTLGVNITFTRQFLLKSFSNGIAQFLIILGLVQRGELVVKMLKYEKSLYSLYCFVIVAITNDHKLSGFKTFIFSALEVRNTNSHTGPKVSVGSVPSEGSEERIPFLVSFSFRIGFSPVPKPYALITPHCSFQHYISKDMFIDF